MVRMLSTKSYPQIVDNNGKSEDKSGFLQDFLVDKPWKKRKGKPFFKPIQYLSLKDMWKSVEEKAIDPVYMPFSLYPQEIGLYTQSYPQVLITLWIIRENEGVKKKSLVENFL